MATILMRVALVLAVAQWAMGADQWQQFQVAQGLPDDQVQFLGEDPDGRVWVGTLNGLAEFRDGKFSVRVKGGEYWDVLKAGPDRYWLGTGNGVVLLEGAKTIPFLPGNTVPLVLPAGEPRYWAIAKSRRTEENHLMESTGAGWQPVETFKTRKIDDMVRTANGEFWVFEAGSGVWQVDPAKPEAAIHHLEGTSVSSVFEDSKKRLWCGLWGGGLMVYDGKGWARHLANLKRSFFFSIREDRAGAIWVATNDAGVWQYVGDKWTSHFEEEGGVPLLFLTSDGKVWISRQNEGGLRYWNGKEWVVSLVGGPIRCLLETRDHKLWAGATLDGVYVRQ